METKTKKNTPISNYFENPTLFVEMEINDKETTDNHQAADSYPTDNRQLPDR